MIQYAIADERLRGPVNAVAPEPATNCDFSRALGRVLHRPTAMTVPAFLLRLVLGEMADGLLLASDRAYPSKLKVSEYRFLYPELDSALRSLLRPTRK
jgi:NAD dependent epimerase/dehydratase family enzyme